MRTRSVRDTDWGRWLSTTTHETTLRGIGTAAGVSHTTVRRWISRGVPSDRAWSLAVRYHADPIELLVLLGKLQPDDVSQLNYAAIVKYVPSVILTEEIHRRATLVMQEHPEYTVQIVSVEARQD